MIDGTPDEVLLRVPARPEYGRVVRVGAAALGLRQGMSFSEIDDLRLVIDEAMVLLLDGVDPDTVADVDIVFRINDGRLELEASRSTDDELRDTAVQRFDAITSGLIDDYDLDPSNGWLRVRKAPAPLDP